MSDETKEVCERLTTAAVRGVSEVEAACLMIDARTLIERLSRELELRKAAVDRWVPCPDHRDKTERGMCYVCRAESAECERDELARMIAEAPMAIVGDEVAGSICGDFGPDGQRVAIVPVGENE